MTNAHRHARPILSLLILVLVSGCTFYGQNNAAKLTHDQLILLNRQVQDSYVRSHATLERLENATTQNEELKPHVIRYKRALTVHGELVNNIEHRWEELNESSDYRKLSSSLRAALTGRELVQSNYQSIAEDLMRQTDDYQQANPFASDAESILIPPFYRALQSALDRHTVVDALRELNF